MPRVLLLESDIDTAEMYATGLRIEGFAAAIAEDLPAALEHIRRGKPDAVVAEASDAARDDWQIVRWCREREAGQAVPVVLLTGYPPSTIPAAASSLGCAALLKPCLPETLAQVIRALINPQQD
jgi:DNA-binding response OmpR family regulator